MNIALWYWDIYCMFLRYYVHDSIVFIIAMFNCFITLLQHVRGQSALCCQIKCISRNNTCGNSSGHCSLFTMAAARTPRPIQPLIHPRSVNEKQVWLKGSKCWHSYAGFPNPSVRFLQIRVGFRVFKMQNAGFGFGYILTAYSNDNHLTEEDCCCTVCRTAYHADYPY